MKTRNIITRVVDLLRGRRSMTPTTGTEELTNNRFGTNSATTSKNQKHVVNTLLLMYSKENETLFI